MERQSVTMKQRPETERPYEKCLKAGAESLTDGELLAVLIRCGTKNYSALELAFALLDRHPVYKGLAGLSGYGDVKDDSGNRECQGN